MKWIMLIWSCVCLYGCLSGMVNIAKLPKASDAEMAGRGIGIILGFGGWFIFWAAVCVPVYLLARIFRKEKKLEVNVPVPESKLCADCGKYYSGEPKFCPNCGKEIVKSN